MVKTSTISLLMAAMVLTVLAAGGATAKDNPGIPFPIRTISAGTEMWALLDWVEAETFNEGVKTAVKDRDKRVHDTSRSEKWQFSATLDQFHFDGTTFSGLWRSAAFQDKNFIEFIRFDGQLDPTGKMALTLNLQKIRYNTTSLVDPLNRGVSVITVRFQDLPGKATLGNKSVVYRFVAGTSKAFIHEGWGENLAVKPYSKIDTKWRAFKIDDGADPVSGQKRAVNASVEFTSRGRQGLPTGGTALEPGTAKAVTVKGDWKGLPEVIAWLSSRPGVQIIDQTSRVQDAVARERELAESGLTSTGKIGAEPGKSTMLVLEVISTGTDPKDMSAKATMKGPAGDTEMKLDLDFDRFKQFGDEAMKEWITNQTETFHLQIIGALRQAGL